MSGKTKQLSGPAKDRFIEQLIASEAGVPQEAARRLATRAKAQIAGVRVRREDGVDLKPLRGGKAADQAAVVTAAAPAKPPAAPAKQAPVAAPASPPEPSKATAAPAPASSFDPFVFGLVPVFQREGRAGLMNRLAGVADTQDLRLMAQKQQIALPAELRAGEVAADKLREAIVAAVEKRIADRKAAAS